jgi:glycosyltransferase involved in cell wall biosynthesis
LNIVQPHLVILSTGGILPPMEWLEVCQDRWPFITVAQANSEHWWFPDEAAARYREGLRAARQCFFVSRANLRLAEKQVGGELLNGEVVRNPFNVDFNTSTSWPLKVDDGEMRLACVARLDPGAKGQDILLEALTNPVWADRAWHLTFYGDGPMRNGVERLVEQSGLAGRVTFAGYVSRVEEIWADNHVLVMPSRFEGLPLAMVEAMLCGRPVIATNVGGHSEIVEDGVSGFLADAPTPTSVGRALERLWERRDNLRTMGEAAASGIRKCVPPDPASVFAQRIRSLVVAAATFRSATEPPSLSVA